MTNPARAPSAGTRAGRWPSVRRWVAWILVAAAAAAVLVLTRPGPRRSALPAVGGPSPVPTAAADVRTGPDAGADDRAGPAASRDAGGDAGGDAGADLRSWLDHGRSAVVRVDQRPEEKLVFAERPRFEPRWDSPTTLRFVDLKEHYRAFRKANDFAVEAVERLSGAAVVIAGAVMPVDPIADSGEMRRLWLANPAIVMAGCVFCSPPTLGDLVLVTASRRPLEVDPERLFRGVVVVRLLGRLHLGPARTADGIEYLFGMDLERELD